MYINVYLFVSEKFSTERPASFSQWGPKACSRGHGQESWIESKADRFGLAEGLAASLDTFCCIVLTSSFQLLKILRHKY